MQGAPQSHLTAFPTRNDAQHITPWNECWLRGNTWVFPTSQYQILLLHFLMEEVTNCCQRLVPFSQLSMTT